MDNRGKEPMIITGEYHGKNVNRHQQCKRVRREGDRDGGSEDGRERSVIPCCKN